jgi:indole-3-glycerol phosphate synthase
MVDFLNSIMRDVEETIKKGYYDLSFTTTSSNSSLSNSIKKNKGLSIITEIKQTSPSLGRIASEINVKEIAERMELSGAVGISILTEPIQFEGSLDFFIKSRETVLLPLLMKDFIIHPIQLEAASKIGADAILLISTVFRRGFSEFDLDSMIDIAHSKKIEVLLETHTEDEFEKAFETKADLIGINNRNLDTFQIDITVTERLLKKIDFRDKPIISESGIKTPSDIKFLHGCGVDAFLIGSAIMQSIDMEGKIISLLAAI